MYAVFRETNYAPGQTVDERSEFREFQTAHAQMRGLVRYLCGLRR